MREVAEKLQAPAGHRVEVIGGTLVVSPTPTGMHGRMLWRLASMLLPYIPAGYELEDHLGVTRRPEGEDFAIPDHFVAPTAVLETWRSTVPPTEVLLVAEVVSRSTLDRTAKRGQYAESGIPAYLLVDPFAAELAAFSDPNGGTYRARHTVAWGEKLQLPEPLPVLVGGSRFPTLDARPDAYPARHPGGAGRSGHSSALDSSFIRAKAPTQKR